jgi:hypothetical protein
MAGDRRRRRHHPTGRDDALAARARRRPPRRRRAHAPGPRGPRHVAAVLKAASPSRFATFARLGEERLGEERTARALDPDPRSRRGYLHRRP